MGFNRLNSDINYTIIYQTHTKKKEGTYSDHFNSTKMNSDYYTGAKGKYKVQHAKLQHCSN